MELVPPLGWSAMATTNDLGRIGSDLRGEMAELRTELKGEMAELRTELRVGLADVRAEIRSNGRTLLLGLLGLQLSAAGLVVGVSKLV